jgi:hypothetical protein
MSDSTLNSSPLLSASGIRPSDINTQKADPEAFFFRLLMDLIDIELGFNRAQESYTKALVERGIHLNIQDMVSQIDLFNNRALKLLIAKEVSGFLGLHAEQDDIMRAEITFMAPRIQAATPPQPKPVGDKRFP